MYSSTDGKAYIDVNYMREIHELIARRASLNVLEVLAVSYLMPIHTERCLCATFLIMLVM